MKGFLILSSSFSASSEMIIFSPFEFVYIVDYVDRFLYIEPSLNSWNEAYLIIREVGQKFSFLVEPSYSLDVMVTVTSESKFGPVLSVPILSINLLRIGFGSSLKMW